MILATVSGVYFQLLRLQPSKIFCLKNLMENKLKSIVVPTSLAHKKKGKINEEDFIHLHHQMNLVQKAESGGITDSQKR